MQFKNPEVLYALFLLIIPVLVHLFKLRKFRRENFTNVKYLQKIRSETRKRSVIKKWLILSTRMLLLACVVIAFARPFFPSEKPVAAESNTLIYLDNSYSMQAMGQRGRLLQRSIQDLLEELPEQNSFVLLTNDTEYPRFTRADLQEISYSPAQLDFESILLKAKSEFAGLPPGAGKLFLISDFQGKLRIPEDINVGNLEIYALPLKPENPGNIAVDSAYLDQENAGSPVLNVLLSATGSNDQSTSVSLYNDTELLGKASVDFAESKSRQLQFQLSSAEILQGRIEIEDNGLPFDNRLFFSLNKKEPIKIAAINAADDSFLKRIFPAGEFEFFSFPEEAIEFNELADAAVIVLNEIRNIPSSLGSLLSKKQEENTVFIIIPPAENPEASFREFLDQTGITGFGNLQEQEKLITGISFQHPLFKGVFQEEIQNFDYPEVKSSYFHNSGSPAVLLYEDQRPFLTAVNNNYIFSAAINFQNSNFKSSPLIVPVFYNMGISALRPIPLYQVLGGINGIEIPVDMGRDEILQIVRDEYRYIPRQQVYANKVELLPDMELKDPGNYEVMKNDVAVTALSFNINRSESKNIYHEIPAGKEIKQVEDTKDFLTSAGFLQETGGLWKWFIIFALFFLILETLLLKYFK